jgi:Icc-related predicted phosphoesterase
MSGRRTCFVVSDLHGHPGRYRALWQRALEEQPEAIFLAGDLLPNGLAMGVEGRDYDGDFIEDFLAGGFLGLRAELGRRAPRVLLVLGNDDPAVAVAAVERVEAAGAWEHIHGRVVELCGRPVLGYACIPPSPFLIKDWERYDISRYVDPGSVSPEDGMRSSPLPVHQIRWNTIARELETLAAGRDLGDAIMLFHAPPYGTGLDRAALDDQMFDHVPIDPHIGSIAIRRFIEGHQPTLSLHGHVHESSRMTGRWLERIGTTVALSAAHEGPGLCLLRVTLDHPLSATREILPLEHQPAPMR